MQSAPLSTPGCGANAAPMLEPSLFSASKIPAAFIWSEAIQENLENHQEKFIHVPTVDIALFRAPSTSQKVAQIAAQASADIGFFHVVNHGIDQKLIEKVHVHSRKFFELDLSNKQKASRLPNESFGYSSSFAGRFSSRLPWKETLSLQPSPVSNIPLLLRKVLGDKHMESSKIFTEYSREMVRVGLEIMEVLAMGLGLDRASLRTYFERPDNSSILRLNYYPPCQQPGLTFGTGPHTDPTALTLLHQDNVSGLQVLHKGIWSTVSPCRHALVANIGDTLMALTNKRYKSCIHRALVNRMQPRLSMAFFFNPGFDTIVSPPEQLVNDANPRAFLDFTWAKFLYFTQSVHRSGVNNLDSFNSWLAGQT
ncbi:hypothetical protein KP509_26G046000 [Ceratopteris richardii]|uniref:Fe2OG dioxygenase domain-containing protein n=1 Tax=Ceratopteris richardii TaxID=49495 RepID=A0A8T2RKB5_CERRI|nr:hypothetical protein KP509_26G046000 [Ceratopteris richardii]